MQHSRQFLLDSYRSMATIRRFEDRVHDEFAGGKIPGFVHLYAGEEASAVGVCSQLGTPDVIASTHRGHGHCIAKGCDVVAMMKEIYGRRDGLCGGKGGSMHIADLAKGMMGANGIVGGGPPLICGAALTAKYLKTGGVAVAFVGDGGSNQGTTLESYNLAKVWRLPVIFVVEDNGYAEDQRRSDLARVQVLRFLVDGLCDPAQTVRVEAVRGLESMEGESALLLRLKARLGDQEAAVTGQVFDSLLRLERDAAIPFLSEFLHTEGEARGEAALALGSSRLPGAVEVLREAWVQAHDFEFRETLLRALSISRQEAAVQFLLDLVRNGRPVDRESAEKALRLHGESPEIRCMLEEALEFHRKERMEG